MDRQFGLIHVRIQTWFPMPIQISERARMARTEVEGQRRVLYQARQCISLDRGHGQGAALRRSIREAELAEDSQQVCAWGDFHKTRICETPDVPLPLSAPSRSSRVAPFILLIHLQRAKDRCLRRDFRWSLAQKGWSTRAF